MKKCEGCATLGAGAERACQVTGDERVKLLSLRVMLQGGVSSLGRPIDKLSRPGPVEALVALVAWRNCELRSLRARGDLVQPRAPSKHLGPESRCVEIDLAGCASAVGGRLSDCPLLAVGGIGMCDIDDTLTEGLILGVKKPSKGGGWRMAGQDERRPFSARLLPCSSLPSYEDLLFCTCTLLSLLPSQCDASVGMTRGWSSPLLSYPILPVLLDLDILLFGRPREGLRQCWRARPER